jgi:hypothetical protein
MILVPSALALRENVRRHRQGRHTSVKSSSSFEVCEKGLDQSGDGWLRCLDGGRVAKVAEGFAGDRADRGQGDIGREGKVRGFEQSGEVASGGATGKGDGVGIVCRCAEQVLESGDRAGRELVAVGFGNGDGGAGGSESFGEDIAGFSGPDEEKGFAGGFREEGLGEGFAGVLPGDKVRDEADVVGGALGGWTDDGDVLGELGKAEQLGPTVEGFDCVRAGEDEPIVSGEAGQGRVEGGEGDGWRDLNGGDEDSGRAEGFELSGEFGGLVAGSGDQDAFVGEGHQLGIVLPRELIEERLFWLGEELVGRQAKKMLQKINYVVRSDNSSVNAVLFMDRNSRS